jgi:hypothetical protein
VKELDTQLKPTAWRFASAAATGQARELYIVGPRGEGKSVAALWGMVMHAVQHKAAGFPLPTTWLGLRDTFANHRLTTHKSLLAEHWGGAWRLSEQDHLATYYLAGRPFVALELVGADSARDADKVRTECHGLWADEAAPAMGVSEGISETLWGIALSSQRLPTHARVALLTSNYPDEEHWTWQRYMIQRLPGTLAFRIPAQERTSHEYREELERAYANRPDLRRRLVEGQPGIVQLGEQVAVGFNVDDHVRYGPPPEVDRHAPLAFATDGGESHTWVTTIAQRVRVDGRTRLRVHAALLTSPAGCRQHMKDTVLPWLSEHAPWVLERGTESITWYDPACDTEDPGDAESNPLRTMRAVLPGTYHPGPVSWAGRRDPLLAVLRSRDPVLEIVAQGAGNAGLIRALNGGWHYPTGIDGRVTRDKPKKPNHPHEDYGDALCYLLAGLAPLAKELPAARLGSVLVAPNAWELQPVGQASVGGSAW